MAGESAVVTPAGVRAGDPDTLKALCDRRGAAVLAYCERVCAPGEAVAAAADAFARFRAAVASAERPADLDPEQLLLTGTRHAAAARAPRIRVGSGLARRLGARGGPTACELVPDLLVARAERTLSAADEKRLERHLDRCTACHAASRRFAAAQGAYADPPSEEIPPPAEQAIVAALAGAAPVLDESDPPSPPLVPPGESEIIVTDARAGAEAREDEDEDDAGPGGGQANAGAVAAWAASDAAATAEGADEAGAAFGEPGAYDELPDEPPAGDGPGEAVDEPGEANGFSDLDAEPGAADGRDTITVRGHPGEDQLPPMPAEIAPPPGHHPRRRRPEGEHRHGPAWSLLLPALVLGAALVAVLALAGVFSGSSRRTASSAPIGAAPAPATAAPATTVHHRRAHHRRSSHRARHVTPAATGRSSTATATTRPAPVTAAPVASTPAPVTRAAPVTHSAPVSHATPSAPTTVQAVGTPSGAAPPSGGAPATGGAGYQPSG